MCCRSGDRALRTRDDDEVARSLLSLVTMAGRECGEVVGFEKRGIDDHGLSNETA